MSLYEHLSDEVIVFSAKPQNKDIVAKFIRNNNVQAIDDIFKIDDFVFEDHELLESVKSQEMLNTLLKNGLDLSKTTWRALMLHRVWIVEFLTKDKLRVKINPNGSDNTHGMPMWRLLMSMDTHHKVMALTKKNKNCTELLDIGALDRNGHIYERNHVHSGYTIEVSGKHVYLESTEKYIYTNRDGKTLGVMFTNGDVSYDDKMRKYMELQGLHEEIFELKNMVRTLQDAVFPKEPRNNNTSS